MPRIMVFAEREYEALRAHLFTDTSREQAAFLLASTIERSGLLKVLIRAVLPLEGADFVEHEAARLVISPHALARAMKRAMGERAALVLVHTHPGAIDEVAFSPVDDDGEPAIFANIERRVPHGPHASMVFGRRAIAARIWQGGVSTPIDRIVIVGSTLRVLALDRPETFDDARYDRQVRAFGAAGQQTLAGLTVAVVGCGGTGSAVAEQLLRLGVGRVLAVDPDVVEESNITRVYGSTAADASHAVPKVALAARLAEALGRPDAIEAVRGDVRDEAVAARLAEADIICGCTDSHWSRLVLNRLAEQYLIPLIDLGTRIDAREGHARSIIGRVSVVLPGRPCLFCAGVVRPEVIAAEALPPEERRNLAAEGYVLGFAERAPAVIALNTVTAGLAVTELLRMATGIPDAPGAPHLIYNAQDGTLRGAAYGAEPGCWCDTGEGYARGDTTVLPGLRRSSE